MSIRKLRLIHSPTPDWEAVRAFYRDALLLPETGGWDLPSDRGSFLTAGPCEIEVMEADITALGLTEGEGPWRVALQVDDLDAERARLQALGVEIARQPETRPWGARDMLIRDPAGNLILLYQEP